MCRTRLKGAVLVAFATGLLAAPSAQATAGALTPRGCIADFGDPAGCGVTQQGLRGAEGVAVSPDGTSVYVASSFDSALVRFDRDTATGALTPQGCFADPGDAAGCGATAPGLGGATDVAMSADGKSVYVTGVAGGTVVRFDRDTATGALTPAGCISDVGAAAGCAATQEGLRGASGVAVTADGKSVYVVSSGDDAVVRFDRDTATGALTPAGCIADPPDTAGCGATQDGLWEAEDLATSPDGASVYVVGFIDAAVVRFDRDTATGALTGQGCIGDPFNGCSGFVTGIRLASGVAVSPDGKSVYVTAQDDVSVVRFNRDTATGALTVQGCFTYPESGKPGCVAREGLQGARGVAISADGRSVYVTGAGDDAVARFDRDTATGALTARGCVTDNGGRGGGCLVTQQGLAVTDGVAVSADGRSLYVTGFSDDALVRFDRQVVAEPTSLSTSPSLTANDNSPRVKGTAEAGSTVNVYTNPDCSSSVVATGTAAAFANPGFTVPVGDDTSTTFYATATDAAGNLSACSTDSVTYVEDSTAARPTALSASPGSPANNNSPRIKGTAEAGSTVNVYTSSDCSSPVAATGTAADFGSPGLAVSVADDTSTTFFATATDPQGNTSPCSTDSVTYVEDSTAPARPSGLSTSPASPSSSLNPIVKGTAEAGSTVSIRVFFEVPGVPPPDCSTMGQGASGTAAAFAGPGLSVPAAFNGVVRYFATATDAAGNTSACSTDSVRYVHDSIPPARPSGLSTSPASPTYDTAPRVRGTAEPGSTVKVYTSPDCSSPVAATGTAEELDSPGLTASVGQGSSTTFFMEATDQAGNRSGCSFDSVRYFEGTWAIPLSTSPASPANDNSPRVKGSATAGSTVKLYTNSDCSSPVAATGTAADFGSSGLAVSVADDTSTTFFATATDPQGNTSPCSPDSVPYVEDSTAPARPSGLSTSPASPSSSLNPIVKGTAEAASTVKIYTNPDCSSPVAATGTAAAFNNPGLIVSVADDSTTTFFATATDRAGLVSACSTDSVTYVADPLLTPPGGPLSTSPASPANDNLPRVMGTADRGSFVDLYADPYCSIPIAGGTAEEFESPGLTVSVADDTSTTFFTIIHGPSGNITSLCSDSVTYVEDSTAPAMPSGLSTSPASPANNNSPRVKGTAEPGSIVRVYTNPDCSSPIAAIGTAAAFNNSGLIFSVGDDSSTNLFTTATDRAGNASACSTDTVTYVEDSTADRPTALSTSPASPANDNSPTVSGVAEPGATVTLYANSDCSSAAAATGTAAAFNGPGLAVAVADDSTTTFHAKATDAVGNVSACSTDAVAYVEDSTAPVTTDDVPGAEQAAAVAVTLVAADVGGSGVERTYYTTGVDPPDPTTASSAYSAAHKPTLGDGQRIKYFSTDRAGNAEPVRTSSALKLQPVPEPPAAPTLTERPPAGTTNRTARYAFTGVAGARFECQLDDREFEVCSSPKTYHGLALGEHSFAVRQSDARGRVSPAVRVTWRVIEAGTTGNAVDITIPGQARGAGDSIGVVCELATGSLSSCELDAYAAVSSGGARTAASRRVHIGHGRRTFKQGGTRKTTVDVTLNRRGRALMRTHPRGLPITFETAARAHGSTRVLHDRKRATVLAETVRLVPAFGMFDPLSARLDETTRRYLRRLRPLLATAEKVRCDGYTSASRTLSRATLRRLGLRRARAVCAYLHETGVDAEFSSRTFGPSHPLAAPTSPRAARINRRVELVITR